MIKRLRRRMTLMVIAVLILVSGGIILSISLSNEYHIASQAEETLSVLAGGSESPSSATESSPPAGKGELS